MKIGDCMTQDVQVAEIDHTLQSAAQTMGEIDAGFLPVTDGERLVGIVTDRDIAIRGVAAGVPASASIREVMSGEVHYCYQDDEVDKVLNNLGQNQLRRLPVVDTDKRLVGVVSITDLAAESAGRAGEALSEIAQPSDLHSQSV